MPVSAAVVAVAFVVLAVYAVLALRSVKQSLDQANRTLADVGDRIDAVSREAMKLLDSTHRLTEDVNGKLNRVDGLFQSIEHVGEAVQQVTSSVKQVSASVSRTFTGSVDRGLQNSQPKIETAVQVATVLIDLWRKIGNLRNESKKGKGE